MNNAPQIFLTPRMLRRVDAAAYFGVSGGTWDKMVKEGVAPAPALRYGTRVVLWDRSDIDMTIDRLKENVTGCEGWADLAG
ncbi:MAG: hypothetical protein JKY31_04935 [Rhodobacteraceae bacterium]|nr:hypothetical protein [Paracoccaceae bacterium]